MENIHLLSLVLSPTPPDSVSIHHYMLKKIPDSEVSDTQVHEDRVV
jgi:hypothetical protein